MENQTRRKNKDHVWKFIEAMDAVTGEDRGDAPAGGPAESPDDRARSDGPSNSLTRRFQSVLETFCSKDVEWKIFHPFNTLQGCEAAARDFWGDLAEALPDIERRLDIFAGDDYKNEYWVTCLGHLCGTFERSWLGIPPTGRVASLRIGEFYKVRDEKIVRAHILLDIPDLMWQAGVYPFRPMPAAPGMVPGPKKHNGLRLGEDDPQQKTLDTVLSMHKALHDFDGKDLGSMQHSQCWSEHFLYYAPAGIGTTRGMEQFRAYHQKPFLVSFPDRHGRDHYVRISDGPIACTSHWGTLTATHTGSGWLGLPATGKKLQMRVADWYCADERGLLHENWLMMDILDICMQMGYDVLADFCMKHRG